MSEGAADSVVNHSGDATFRTAQVPVSSPEVDRAEADADGRGPHGPHGLDGERGQGGDHGRGKHDEHEAPCFCRGTLILTPAGEIPVEALRLGDRVITLSGTEQPITWIGRGTRPVTELDNGSRPLIVRPDALADGVPKRDLRLTRGHSLYLDGMLVPVECLENGRSILWDKAARSVEFYHFELPQHEVIYADGAPAETYRDDGNRDWFDDAEPPSIHSLEKAWYAPVVTGGAELNRLWRRLLDRAGFAEPAATADPDLHLIVDGNRVEAFAIDEQRHGHQGVYRFRLEQRPKALQLVSRSVIPYAMGLNRDGRRLGVAVRSITLADPGCTLHLRYDAAQLMDGFHEPETEGRQRWTSGEAGLPESLFSPFAGAFEIAIEISCTARYPLGQERERAEPAESRDNPSLRVLSPAMFPHARLAAAAHA